MSVSSQLGFYVLIAMLVLSAAFDLWDLGRSFVRIIVAAVKPLWNGPSDFLERTVAFFVVAALVVTVIWVIAELSRSLWR